jgi:nucleoside-diphosphate-sugar epimerase
MSDEGTATPKRVAITGGSGRVGRYVVDRLMKTRDVKVLDLHRPSQAVAFAEADVLDLDTLRREFSGFDVVVHLAAIDFDLQAAPEKYIHINVQGTWNVLQAAREAGVKRVVLCSSISACGLSEANPNFPPDFIPVNEDHPEYPIQAYSVSKLLMEKMAESFVRDGNIEVVCLRLMMVLLPENIQPTLKRAADADSRWLFYYVTPEDCAHAFECAVAASGISGTFFITAEDSCRAEPTLDWVKRVFGDRVPVHDRSYYDANPRASIFDGRRARDVLGFQPSSNWIEVSGVQQRS